ncbi:hypothetical protein Vadar_032992 [Vaccinium darrowii]|uniref:Uncharacterized protein n=1 Tax=Vaccinium darrowii TaxID=229202 RepID=A0ACB7Z959_9ERIC|nr:hypothetical protein Vadar_032992 [Vaccinium darrowii]
MADLDRSSKDTSVDSRGDDSQDSELQFSDDEETLIIRMFNLVGERWSLIAGRIPGRTAEEIEKYWNSRFKSVHRKGKGELKLPDTEISGGGKIFLIVISVLKLHGNSDTESFRNG